MGNVAAGEDAGDGEGPALKARKKRKTDTRGAEDREEVREDKEAEAEGDGEKDLHEKNDDAPSEKSGMYSDEDSLSDPDDAGQEEDGNAKNPVEGDEGAEDDAEDEEAKKKQEAAKKALLDSSED